VTTTENQYLAGNFGPVREEITADALEVTGAIPASLDGRFLRNGPNPVVPPDPSTYHWFTGSGMVHGLRLRDGTAEWYRNRWVRAPDVSDALGEERKPSPFADDVQIFAANTTVIGHAGRTFALVEAGSPPVELTYELDTIGPCDFDGTLEHPFSAHPKRDPDTGELHVAAYWWAWGNRIRYMVVDVDGRVRKTVDLEVPGGPMVHDMAITERYAVLFDLPCTFDLDVAMQGAALPYRWNPDYGARVGLLTRDGEAEDVRWFDVEPCYVFHPMNAYDDGDRVVLDLVRHPKMFDTDLLGPNEGPPRLDRWTIDIAAGKVIEETLSDAIQEFPRHDERLVGKRNRYGYAAQFGVEGGRAPVHGSALKHDLSAGTTETRDFGAHRQTGELVFVPADEDAAEDDGFMLSFVYDLSTDTSDMEIWHAQDFTGDPIAVVHLPQRVPFGFHGNWVPDAR
jgi:carotenoid cleavage dioxygenase